jgi:hypothetical protein
MIESGALIQTYVDTYIELQDAELLMPANDQNLFEDDVDEEHGTYETADELEEEFVEDDRISSNQQALQEVETELDMPTQATVLPSTSAQATVLPSTSAQATVLPSTSAQATVLPSTSAQDTVLPSTSAQDTLMNIAFFYLITF